MANLRRPRRHERADEPRADSIEEPTADEPAFRIGRLLFGGVLAITALDNLRNLDERTAYAKAKGAPVPSLSVPATSLGLLVGSVGVALWRYPTASATAVVGFLAAITPVMHDFWNVDDPEEEQRQRIQFLKNTALLGAALAFLTVGRSESTSRD